MTNEKTYENENILKKMNRRNITISFLKEKLEQGYTIIVDATGNMSSGSHDYWFSEGRMHCFGRGQNWSDQDDSTSLADPQEAAELLYTKRSSILSIFYDTFRNDY